MDGQIIHDVQDARTTHQQDGDIGKEKRSKGKKTKIRVNPKEIIEDHPLLEMNCESKSEQKVLDALCNEMHTKVLNQWGTFACHCGLVPILELSQTPRNVNKVFLSCSKTRETRCGYFQWVYHQAPKPNYVPKTATR